MATHTEPEKSATPEIEKVQATARQVPITDEVKAHLQAAGSMADNRFATMRAMIEAAIEPMWESNRHIGYDLELTDDEVCRIVWAVRGALDYGYGEVVKPIYERLRGEPPHVMNGGGPPPDEPRATAPAAAGAGVSRTVQDARRQEVEDACSQLGGRMQVAETLLTAAYESGRPMEYPEVEAVLEAVQEVREGLSEIVQVVYGRRDEDAE